MKKFFIIPNVVNDMGLDVYAYRLYCHIVRVAGKAGTCWQSVRTMARICRMSPAQVSRARTRLAKLGLIKLQKGGNRTLQITLPQSLPDITTEAPCTTTETPCTTTETPCTTTETPCTTTETPCTTTETPCTTTETKCFCGGIKEDLIKKTHISIPLKEDLIKKNGDSQNLAEQNQNTDTATTTITASASHETVNPLKLFAAVTGWMALPSDNADNAIRVLESVIANFGTMDKSAEYLQPYWAEFRRRYPNSTRTFWLTDWAASGIIPPQKQSGANQSARGTRRVVDQTGEEFEVPL